MKLQQQKPLSANGKTGINRRTFLVSATLAGGAALLGRYARQYANCFAAENAPEKTSSGKMLTLISRQTEPLSIVIGVTASEPEKFAAQEMADCLKKITGQTFPMVDDMHLPTGGKFIAIGRNKLTASFNTSSLDVEQAIIDVSSHQLSIIGGRRAASPGHAARDAGTLYGVYDFLEGLGVRWYRPEDWGEHVPQMQQIELPIGHYVSQRPDFTTRAMMSGGYTYWREETPEQTRQARLWCVRNRINNGYTLPNLATQFGGMEEQAIGDHNWPLIIPASEYFEAHPEYFALVNGKRVPYDLCPGNPDVQNLYAQKLIARAKVNPYMASFSAEPGDGKGGTCECPLCKALDEPQNTRIGGKWSNRVSAFGNIVAALVAQETPWVKVQWLGYAEHTAAPTNTKQLQPNTIIMLCPINGWDDWRKNLMDRSSAQNSLFVHTTQDWTALKPASLMTFLYFNGYGWPGPLPITRTVADRMRSYREIGIKGNYLPGCISWGPAGLDWYMTAKLFWNPDLDVDKELDLYYTNYYGPAAGPMKAYHELLMNALETASESVFSGGRGMYALMTPDLITKLGTEMNQALALVKGHALYEKRLAGVAAGYECSRRVSEILELKKTGQNARAQQAFQELKQYLLSFDEGDAVFDVTAKDKTSEKPISGSLAYLTSDLGMEWL